MEASKTERKPGISLELTRRRLKVFSLFARDESPPDDSSASTPLLETAPREAGSKTERRENFAVIPKAPETQRTPVNSRRRISRFCMKPSDTLKLSSVKQEQLPQLKEMLAQFGSIIAINSTHIAKGILLITYSKVEEAKAAFNQLLEYKLGNQKGIQVAYVYDEQPGETVLTSIHESSDSSKSDRSEDGNSDNEKKKADKMVTEVIEEVKSLPKPIMSSPAEAYATYFTPPRMNPRFSPSPYTPLVKKDLNKTAYVELSECSFDNDTVNEGIEVNIPHHTLQRQYPTSYYHTPTGSIIHTESTTNIDSDEALSSSGRFDREFSASFYTPVSHSRKNSNLNYQSPGLVNYSPNPQLMWTQPVKPMEAHAPVHTHTRSYDIAALGAGGYNPMAYMCPPAPPMGYYPSPYIERGDYSWEESMGYYYHPMAHSFYPEVTPTMPKSRKGVRKKNPESESTRAFYTINLEDILNKKDLRTTIMIKNIPNKYNQKMLLKKIDEKHKRLYDFFYLPIDFKNKCNVGYAFINFVNPLYILKFYEEFNAHKWEKFNSEKICQLTYARIQGKQALMLHFQSSSTMCQQDKKVRPLILSVQGASVAEMAEYEKKLKQTTTVEKIRELARKNTAVFGGK